MLVLIERPSSSLKLGLPSAGLCLGAGGRERVIWKYWLAPTIKASQTLLAERSRKPRNSELMLAGRWTKEYKTSVLNGIPSVKTQKSARRIGICIKIRAKPAKGLIPCSL